MSENQNFGQKRIIPPPPPPRPTVNQRPIPKTPTRVIPQPPVRPQVKQPEQVKVQEVQAKVESVQPSVKPVSPVFNRENVNENVGIKSTIETKIEPAKMHESLNQSRPVIPPKPVKQKIVKGKQEREPLSNQSKGILFGLLGGFFLFGSAILLALVFIL
ncbi:MAG: hypothetical protein E7379_01105 [Clostridiales bacterium]|nr:hypothetical protein [Clostridiales bacterium]